MNKREFCSVAGVRGYGPDNGENEIVVAFYGTRGGVRSIEALSVEQARSMAQQINEAIEKLAGG